MSGLRTIDEEMARADDMRCTARKFQLYICADCGWRWWVECECPLDDGHAIDSQCGRCRRAEWRLLGD